MLGHEAVKHIESSKTSPMKDDPLVEEGTKWLKDNIYTANLGLVEKLVGDMSKMIITARNTSRDKKIPKHLRDLFA